MRLRTLATAACTIALLAAAAPGAAARPGDGVDLNACGSAVNVIAIPIEVLSPGQSDDCASEG
ncbi:hypothetical protein [Streptomyces sp. NBRC 110611]|uniref:hypothetical protein n=1 Tax=Streptomyces sp. NBRC 110611 TaxID=1621259 RepID=UPI000832A6A6|nr:hypothetical protein [Streptomyces sp. NBRC 110611]